MSSKCIKTWPKLVLFGDSLTQFSFSEIGGWGRKIADLLQRKCDVVNRGFSGYNSSWNKLMLPNLITEENADSIAGVVIFLGANDSTLPESNQHVDVENYKNNLVAMVEYLQDIGVTSEKIVLIGPPPCDEKSWLVECKIKNIPMQQDNAYKKQYSVACRMAAADTGTHHVELFLNMKKNPDWTSYLCDGLHFSNQGSDYLSSELLPIIQEMTKDLPNIMPDWKNVNHVNPEESLQ